MFRFTDNYNLPYNCPDCHAPTDDPTFQCRLCLRDISFHNWLFEYVTNYISAFLPEIEHIHYDDIAEAIAHFTPNHSLDDVNKYLHLMADLHDSSLYKEERRVSY